MILTSAIFLEANSLNLNWLCDTDTNLDALIAEQEELIFTSIFDNNYSESRLLQAQILLAALSRCWPMVDAFQK